jgi:prevent-host-death family protein
MPSPARTVGAFEAKTKFSELLERVGHGEEITITKHEKPVARLVPVTRSSASEIREAFQQLERIRSRTARDSMRKGELSYRQLIEEGRRR